MEKRNILIVGNASVIGTYLKTDLEARHNVSLCGRNNCDLKFDLTEWNQSIFSDRVDTLICVAGNFEDNSLKSIFDSSLTNAAGMANVVALAKLNNVSHIVLISSQFALCTASNEHYGTYSVTKRHGEEIATLACSKAGIALTIIRPTQVYDCLGYCRKHQRLLYTFVDNALANKDLVITTNSSTIRNYVHVADLVKVIDAVINQRIYGTYCVASPDSISISQLAHAIVAESCSTANVIETGVLGVKVSDMYELGHEIWNLARIENRTSILVGIRCIIATSKEHR